MTDMQAQLEQSYAHKRDLDVLKQHEKVNDMQQIKAYEKQLDDEKARRDKATKERQENALKHQGNFLELVVAKKKANESAAEKLVTRYIAKREQGIEDKLQKDAQTKLVNKEAFMNSVAE